MAEQAALAVLLKGLSTINMRKGIAEPMQNPVGVRMIHGTSCARNVS